MEYAYSNFDDATEKARASFELIATAQRGRAEDATAEEQLAGEQAFGEIYLMYSENVRRFVRARIQQAEAAEDITSEVFVRAFRNVHRFEWQGKDVGAWFITIARNLVTDYFKSARVRLAAIADDEFLMAMPDTRRSGRPEEMAIMSDEIEALSAALSQITPEQREVIELRYLHELSVQETAEKLGRNASQVKSLGHRAMHSLLRIMSKGVPISAVPPKLASGAQSVVVELRPEHGPAITKALTPKAEPPAKEIASTPVEALDLPAEPSAAAIRLMRFLRLPAEGEEAVKTQAVILEHIASLDVPEKAKRAAILQFGLEDGEAMLQEDIADLLGFTRKQVAVMVTSVKQKLRVKTWQV